MRRNGRVVTGAILVVVGVAWLLESAGIVDLSSGALLSIALIVIGIALVATRGMSTGLLIAGIVISIILMGDSSENFVNIRDERSIGRSDRVYRPRRANDLRPYRVDAGELKIDLTRIDLEDDGTHDVNGRVSAGQILVLVPQDVPIRVVSQTGAGSITVLGDRRVSGVSVEDTFESPDYDDERPRIDMTLRATVGTIRVEAED